MPPLDTFCQTPVKALFLYYHLCIKYGEREQIFGHDKYFLYRNQETLIVALEMVMYPCLW